MSRSLFLIALIMFCFDAFAETHIIAVDEHIRERHSWTLGYQPDQVISRYRTDVDPPLKLDIFFPKDHSVNDKRSCVIFFFGGGWMGGATAQFYGSSRYLASRGMVAISAEYRTHNRHKAIPKDCVEDGRQAIRYVREHSAELGIDPNKIVLSGGSAGGHIAAAVAMCEQIDAKPKSLISSVPNALVLFNPVYNNGPNGGYGHSRVKAYWQAISPHHNIQPGLPPTIVFFGSADNCVPIEQVHAFQIAMDIAKNDCSTHVYQGEKHGFFHISKGGRKLFEDILTKVDHFLVNQDLLTGEQQVKRWTTKAIAHLQKRKHQNK